MYFIYSNVTSKNYFFWDKVKYSVNPFSVIITTYLPFLVRLPIRRQSTQWQSKPSFSLRGRSQTTFTRGGGGEVESQKNWLFVSHYKVEKVGSFTNYVDTFLSFFDEYIVKKRQKRVNIVCERSLKGNKLKKKNNLFSIWWVGNHEMSHSTFSQ